MSGDNELHISQKRVCCFVRLGEQHKLFTNNVIHSRTKFFLAEFQNIFTENTDKFPPFVFLNDWQKTFSSTFSQNAELIIHSLSISDKDKYFRDSVTA